MAPRYLRSIVLVVVVAAVAGCSVVSPPPLIPMHAGTAPEDRGATSVTLVIGVTGELLGGDGWGVALRGEQQVRDQIAVGAQLGGGRGKEGRKRDGQEIRHWLVELRGYGRVASTEHDWASAMASVGWTAMDTELRAFTLAIGGAVSYPNQYVVPAYGVFAAVSLPFERGRGFGDEHDEYPRTTWWFGSSLAAVVPIGSTGNAASFEAGVAFGDGGDDSSQLNLSAAERHTF